MNPGISLPIVEAPARGLRLRLNPFLHVGEDRLYNPLTDLTLVVDAPHYASLRALQDAEKGLEELPSEVTDALARDGWLVPADEDVSQRYRLKYVSLEAHTVCNQACYFCPVSLDPREDHFMPTETYERIIGQIAELGEPIEAVFMISYNEPTLDKRFVDQVRCIKEAGLPPATLTNGSGLTPQRVDQLVELGGLRYLSINLSTIDRERYGKERGADHLKTVLRNLDYAADKPVGERMEIVVLGTGDVKHQRDFEAISERFEDTRFLISQWIVNDRAGYLQLGLTARDRDKSLCGCDHMGSRPLQHLHITPRAECILCCQDYSETTVVGDLNRSTVREVLEGPEMARARRQVYGLEEAPANFICNNCKFALRRHNPR
ncbi:MAG: radical SAM protein [Acidobacteria bacterium]|nr:radical SAM protein [Acidobacteriota bacterium]